MFDLVVKAKGAISDFRRRYQDCSCKYKDGAIVLALAVIA